MAHKNNKGKRTNQTILTILGVICFLAYMTVLVYLLFFADEYGRSGDLSAEYRYNIIPFTEIKRFLGHTDMLGFYSVALNVGGNILAFVPFGFMLPSISKKAQHFAIIMLLGFLLSVCVELIQLFTHVGVCDVDDVILNTLGSLFGYLGFLLFRQLCYINSK